MSLFGFGQMGMPGAFGLHGGSFKSQYRCFSVSIFDRQDLERGGKIIMPPSALDQLTQLNIQYPMLFKLIGRKDGERVTHCGVLEFVADEGKVYLPYWMMKILCLEEGDLISIESVSLPLASFAKFEPLEEEFHEITNPKAVLETNLRSFACLTTGDIIEISYNDRLYRLSVLDTKPGTAVSIIECDMEVDFTPPRSLTEKPPQQEAASSRSFSQPAKMTPEEIAAQEAIAAAQNQGFHAFSGQGFRLDSKTKKRGKGSKPQSDASPAPRGPGVVTPISRGVPNLDYRKGKITFTRNFQKRAVASEESNEPEFVAFAGTGHSMRRRR